MAPLPYSEPPVHPLEPLSRLAAIAARASQLSEVFDQSLECLERTLGADRSSILLFDTDGVMRFKASRGLSERYRRKVEGHSPWSRDEKDPEPVLIPDVASQPDFDAYRVTILEEGIHALAFIPIVAGGSLLGKFMIYFDRPHRFTTEEIQLARMIATHIAFGVERTLLDQVRRDPENLAAFLESAVLRQVAERRLGAEHAVTRILAEAQSLNHAIPRILQSLGECLGCVFAAFWQLDSGSTVVRCTETWRSPGVTLEDFDNLCRSLSFERGRGLPGHVWQNGTPTWISDLSDDETFARRPVARSAGLRSGFAFPVRVGDRFLGIMEFFLIHPAEPDERLLDMMAAIGSEIGQFIDRKEVEAELERNERRFRTMAEAMPEILFTHTPEGVTDFLSPRYYEYTGIQPGPNELEERLHAVHPEDAERVRLLWKESLASGKPYEVEYRLRGKDGVYRWFRGRSVPIFDSNGDVSRWLGVSMDIDDSKRNEERLTEANQAKDDFLAMLAHELRNPLSPIRSAVHVMRQVGVSDPLLERSRDIIDRQVSHMARIIDDLLDVSRISRGMILLRRERVDLVALVRATFADHRAEVEQRSMTVILDLPEEPLWVSGDPTRLAQIVGNILQNATKFTDPGGTIRVRARCEPETSQVVLSIRDSGIGMESRMLERVFDTFTQVDRSLEHRGGGLGLGLALVKGLVALHGGSVRATSEGLGRGSEFSIRLPQSTAPPSTAKSNVVESPPMGCCRVLVIEDHPDSGESAELSLRLSGHVVRLARSGREGIAAAREFSPDVVLCDIGLEGGMDGYAVARALRSDPAFVGSYLVAVTGYGREEDIQRAREAGFDRHLTKPVDPKTLELMLREVAARLPAIRA